MTTAETVREWLTHGRQVDRRAQHCAHS